LSGSDEEIPEEADQETTKTRMACRGLRLVVGLFFMTYLVARLALETYPHQLHWLSIPIGLTGTILGIPLGLLWYRLRGDII